MSPSGWRVLTISDLYPSPPSPANGIFVERQVHHLLPYCDLLNVMVPLRVWPPPEDLETSGPPEAVCGRHPGVGFSDRQHSGVSGNRWNHHLPQKIRVPASPSHAWDMGLFCLCVPPAIASFLAQVRELQPRPRSLCSSSRHNRSAGKEMDARPTCRLCARVRPDIHGSPAAHRAIDCWLGSAQRRRRLGKQPLALACLYGRPRR